MVHVHSNLKCGQERKLVVLHDSHLCASRDVINHGPEQPSAVLPLLLAQRHVRQPEYGVAQPTHGHGRVDGDGIGLHKQPIDQLLQLFVRRVVPCLHQRRKDARNQIGRDAHDAQCPVVVHTAVRLVVVSAPHRDAVLHVPIDPVVPGAFLDAQKAGMRVDLVDNLLGNVLARPARHVVNHRRSLLEHRFEVLPEPGCGCLAVVGVDVERGVHPHPKALLRGVDCLPGRIRPCVPDDLDPASKLVHGVCNEHNMLVPGHQMPLPRGATDDDTLDPVGNLVGDVLVVGVQVKLPVGKIRRLQSGDCLERFERSRRRRSILRPRIWRHLVQSRARPRRRQSGTIV
mmetsp:Transcript_3146/g.9307  ORF Transcript_3146/g.9307 Transcript_3146/m.9307 type:complete len:343 (+) Transcript_3146:48-1076(+)